MIIIKKLTACTYLSYCCVSDLTLANFSFLFLRGQRVGEPWRRNRISLCGHRLAWNLRVSLASAAQAGFRGNRPSWLTYNNSEEWLHWAHLTGKENKAQGMIYTHPKEQSQYPKHGACLQRRQFFHYSTHMVMGNENKGYKSAATDSTESAGKGQHSSSTLTELTFPFSSQISVF